MIDRWCGRWCGWSEWILLGWSLNSCQDTKGKKNLERICVYVVWNFVGIIETSNVKKKSQKLSKDTSFKKPKSSWLSRSWILNFQNGCVKAEFGDAVFYTLLDMLSVIFLVIVWYMIWLSCFKANYFWDSLSGSPPKSYYYYFDCADISLKRGRNFVVGFCRNDFDRESSW